MDTPLTQTSQLLSLQMEEDAERGFAGAEIIKKGMKTPFTHEGLVERGFTPGHNWYSKDIGEMELSISNFTTEMSKLIITAQTTGWGGEPERIHQFTTIDTLEDLDTFLSFMKI